MPRLHIPAVKKRPGWQRAAAGKGFATALQKNQRRKNDSSSLDLLQWQDDSTPSFAPKQITVKDKSSRKRKSTELKVTTTRSAAKTTNSATKRASSMTKRNTEIAPRHHHTTTPTAVTPAAPKKKASSNRRALAVDNRILQTVTCDAAGRVFMNHVVESFLATLTQRGAAPCIVASLQQASSKKQIEVKAECEWNDLWKNSPIHIPAPSNMSNTANRNAIHVPNKLLAHNSYKFFGNLVESMVQVDAETFDQVRPLDVTILTSDVAFLSDTKEDSHKHGIHGFWNQVGKCHQAVGSITIVVVETGAGLYAVNQDGWEKNESLTQHRLLVRKCLQSVKNEILLSSRNEASPVNMEITSIENNKIDFQLLAGKWITQLCTPSLSASRISFSLPETVDGTQCSVDLDLVYKIMPFRADSPAAAQLRGDMELLSRCDIQVLQMIPLDNIDASLLFGVPMAVRAGMEQDLSRFREMKLLVQCLWKYLVEQQVALVLRARTPKNTNISNGGGLYFDESGETFLLMADEVSRKRQQSFESTGETEQADITGGTRGTLFRYACQNHVLDLRDDGDDMDCMDDALCSEYTEYIENSCEFLNREPYNPFVAGDAMLDAPEGPNATNTRMTATSETPKHTDGDNSDDVMVDWGDNEGVGARPSQDSASSTSSSSLEEIPGEFEYFSD